MTKVAVLDLGLCAFHVAVFEAGAGGVLARRRVFSEAVGVDDGAAGRSPGASPWGIAAVHRLLRELAALDGSCPVVAIASPSLRAVHHAAALAGEIRRRHGLSVQVLSGEGAARLSYLGAALHLRSVGRLAVADLDGGSLELSTGAGGECDLVFSIPLGTVDLRDVHVHAELPLDRSARERVAATVRFAAADAARAIWDRRPDGLAFASATAEVLGALADELGLRPPGRDDLDLASLRKLADVLAQFRPIDLSSLGVADARSDTIAVGAVVLQTLMELLGFESAVVSPSGRREGVAVRHLGRVRAGTARDRVHLAVT